MTDLRKAAEMALEVLVKYDNDHTIQHYVGIKDSIEALRQALAQPEQKQYVTKVVAVHEDGTYTTERIPLPKREWVGLTDEERADCWSSSAVQSAINIEAKLKEKNSG